MVGDIQTVVYDRPTRAGTVRHATETSFADWDSVWCGCILGSAKKTNTAGSLIANYRITDPDAYQAYPPAVVPTLRAHGAEMLVTDYESEAVEGGAAHVTIVIQ